MRNNSRNLMTFATCFILVATHTQADGFLRDSNVLPSGDPPPPPPAGLVLKIGPPEFGSPTTNSIPFQDSFEQYHHGQSIAGTNGWAAEDPDAITVLTTNYVSAGQYPLPPATHTNALMSSGSADMLVEGESPHVWVDLMVNPWRWDQDDPPAVQESAQTAFCVSTAGYIRALCSWQSTGGEQTNGWLTLQHAPVSEQEWFRLTCHFAYQPDGSNNYFAVQVNSVSATHAYGELLPSDGSGGGPWLRCPSNSITAFPGISFFGAGYIDDLVVTDSFIGPTNAPSTLIWTAVEIGWQSEFGMKYQAEWCTDLLTPEWAPLGEPVYGNGTSNSVFDSMRNVDHRFYRVTIPE